MFKKFSIGILLLSLIVGIASAVDVAKDDYRIPRDANFNVPGDINLVGAKYKHLETTTITQISTRPCIIYGVIIEEPITAVTTGYVVLFDSHNVTGLLVTASTNRILPALVQESTGTIKEIYFSPPIITQFGLVAKCGFATMGYTVLYRERVFGNK